MIGDSETLGKHYTAKEETGLTAKETKLLKLALRIRDLNDNNLEDSHKSNNDPRVFSYRLVYQRIISSELMIQDSHFINNWLNTLIGLGVLSPKEASELYFKTAYSFGVIRPSANTKYYINTETLEALILSLLIKKGKDTHRATLDQYSNTKSGSILSDSQTMQNTEVGISDREENQKVLVNLQKRIN
jgi:hypothetical protein